MLLVEDSGFSNCSSKTEGGSVFYGNNGRISLNRVCSDRSRTPKDGVFCSINATNEHEIKIFDSSISFSGDKSFDGKRNIKIDGNANFSSINVSFANVLNRCLFQILSITKESKIDFSIFNNNSQVKEVRLEESFINGDKNVVFKIQFCYFLGNKGSDNNSLMRSFLITHFYNCSFQENTNNDFKFRNDNEIALENCYIADTQPDDLNPVIYKNNVTSPYTLSLADFSSFACEIYIPITTNHMHHYIMNFSILMPFIIMINSI